MMSKCEIHFTLTQSLLVHEIGALTLASLFPVAGHSVFYRFRRKGFLFAPDQLLWTSEGTAFLGRVILS